MFTKCIIKDMCLCCELRSEMQFIRRLLLTHNPVMNAFKTMSDTEIPLVVIIGATGCAKTKLSIEMSEKLPLKTEIISADSMQVYRGLDVITNKATTEDRQRIPHHLIDFLDPLSRFSVVDFRNRALKVVLI